MIDIEVQNCGSVFLFRGQTARGEEWLTDNLDPEVARLGEAFAVEHRYAWDIAQGAIDAGMEVK